MADFIIVIAAAAALAGSAPAPSAAPASAAPAATASVPLSAPTVGFRTYRDLASCEQAAAALVAPPGSRPVCLPVEPLAGDLVTAY
jgi:hypothetical protein